MFPVAALAAASAAPEFVADEAAELCELSFLGVAVPSGLFFSACFVEFVSGLAGSPLCRADCACAATLLAPKSSARNTARHALFAFFLLELPLCLRRLFHLRSTFEPGTLGTGKWILDAARRSPLGETNV